MEAPGHLAAELRRSAVVEPELLDPTAGPIARLQHTDVSTSGCEIACRGQAGEPGAEHQDIGQAVVSSRRMLPRISSRAPSPSRSPR